MLRPFNHSVARLEEAIALPHPNVLKRASILKGELLLTGNAKSRILAEAEACFQKALDIAHGQGALLFELRAASSLARLLDTRRKRDAAHRTLAPVYARFTEGFDTPDLKDAKALLDALA